MEFCCKNLKKYANVKPFLSTNKPACKNMKRFCPFITSKKKPNLKFKLPERGEGKTGLTVSSPVFLIQWMIGYVVFSIIRDK
jgi:hypothetical protein